MNRVTWIFLMPLLKYGVFGADKIKEVLEEDSLTLQTSFSEIKSDDQILWLYGKIIIANIHKASGIFETHENRADGIFKGKLSLDKQNGNLIIKDIRIKNSGDYHLDINSGATSTKFSVKVYARLPTPTIGFTECAPTPAGSSSPVCVVQCSVQTVGLVTLSWNKENSVVSSRISDTCSSLFLRLEVDYNDKNTYSCMVKNPISNQTTHLDISGLCQPCAGVSPGVSSGLSPGDVAGIVVVLLVAAAVAAGVAVIYYRRRISELQKQISSVTVKEGEDVTLKPNNEIKKDDDIQWWFGEDEQLTIIAEIRQEPRKPFTPGYVAGGRFRGRLELDETTGSLTIRNIRTTHTGPYTIHTSSSGACHVFFVTVTENMEDKPVKEGESVTLNPDTEIQRDDQMLWMFGDQDDLIAQVRGGTLTPYHDGAGDIFRDRVKLNETGSLTITDMTPLHAGPYKLQIINSKGILVKKFRVFIPLRSVLITVGGSVHLSTGLTEIQRDEEIQWTFGDDNSLIAEIKGGTGDTYIVPDERFRDRLQLNEKTGDLTILYSTAEDDGLYKVKIHNSKGNTSRTYGVTIRDEGRKSWLKKVSTVWSENESDVEMQPLNK